MRQGRGRGDDGMITVWILGGVTMIVNVRRLVLCQLVGPDRTSDVSSPPPPTKPRKPAPPHWTPPRSATAAPANSTRPPPNSAPSTASPTRTSTTC